MTSRDALSCLITNQKEVRDGYKFVNLKTLETATVEDCYDTIMRDLEVLEILKNESDNKRLIIKDGVASFHLDMILTTDNYNKIKEWLENDK